MRRRHNHCTFSFVLVFGRIQPSIQRAVCARQPDTTTTKQGTAALFLIFLIFDTSASTAKIEHFYKVKHAVVQSSMYRTFYDNLTKPSRAIQTPFLDAHPSLAPTLVRNFVRLFVILSDFHSVSVSELSQNVETTLWWPTWWTTWRWAWRPT